LPSGLGLIKFEFEIELFFMPAILLLTNKQGGIVGCLAHFFRGRAVCVVNEQ
jgi:hypothetical protein